MTIKLVHCIVPGEKVIIVPLQFYGVHKKIRSMTITSNLGQLKPKLFAKALIEAKQSNFFLFFFLKKK